MHGIDKVIDDNKGLVYRQLNRMHLLNDPEAESIGFEALYKAVKDYDESKGYKLSTLATVYIYNALGSYIRKLKSKRVINTVSYNNVPAFEDPHGDEYIDSIVTANSAEEMCMQDEGYKAIIVACNKLYDNLTNEKHKAVIKVWICSDFRATKTEIAEAVGVSQSYVSQIILKFKNNLKKELEEK